MSGDGKILFVFPSSRRRLFIHNHKNSCHYYPSYIEDFLIIWWEVFTDNSYFGQFFSSQACSSFVYSDNVVTKCPSGFR